MSAAVIGLESLEELEARVLVVLGNEVGLVVVQVLGGRGVPAFGESGFMVEESELYTSRDTNEQNEREHTLHRTSIERGK